MFELDGENFTRSSNPIYSFARIKEMMKSQTPKQKQHVKDAQSQSFKSKLGEGIVKIVCEEIIRLSVSNRMYSLYRDETFNSKVQIPFSIDGTSHSHLPPLS